MPRGLRDIGVTAPLECDRIITLRDTTDAARLVELVADARRVVIVGNGGIALELAHEVRTLGD